MSESSQFDHVRLPPASVGAVCRGCDQFEAQWQAGCRPVIEDYLKRVSEEARPALLRELLRLEVRCRLETGERPLPQEYVKRFAGQAPWVDGLLRELFPPSASQAERGAVGTDRNLLLGVLALQLDFITSEDLIEALHAWVRAKNRPLGRLLVERKALSEERHARLEALVREREPEPDLAANSDIATLPFLPPLEPTYAKLRLHGKGGLGEVYLAHDRNLDRQVALKEAQARFADSPAHRARFLREAQITGRLEHPGIVPVHALGTHSDGRPFYVMRFMDGDNFQEAIRNFHKADEEGREPGERALAFRELLGRFIDVCHAVAYAHSRGIVHRDLKPANIMLGRFGETLVVDWGLAKPIGGELTTLDLEPEAQRAPGGPAEQAETAYGRPIGSPAYMAPEQAEGQLERIDARMDIYCLGATLFEVLTGSPPHTREKRTPDPPRAGVVRPGVPAALDQIVARAMAPEPPERYPDARRLAADLQRWLAEEPIEAYRQFVAELEGLARRHPGVIDYREQLSRNQVSLGLVLCGIGRHGPGEEAYRRAITEYQALIEEQPHEPRHRAELATTRAHLSRVLLALNRREEAERVQQQATADYERLMRMSPHTYSTNLASVFLTIAPAPRQHPTDPGPLGTVEPWAGRLDESAAAAGGTTDLSMVEPGHGEETPRPPEPPAEARSRFSNFRQLARGGGSIIWLAEDNDLNRKVVLKELLFLDRPEVRARFMREAQVTAQLEHPNIVACHGLGRRSGTDVPFLILQYIEGPTLQCASEQYHSQLPHDPRGLRYLLRAFVGACRGVAFAHCRGVIHRDPKPANIMLGPYGEGVVIDWGLAALRGESEEQVSGVKLSEWSSTRTLTGTILGTPAYMSPEMVARGAAQADERSDVYSLGATLFHVLTGQPPLVHPTTMETLEALRAGDVPRPRGVNPSVPRALDAICARAMAHAPENRYPSVADLARDVESWLDGGRVTAYPESILRRWGRNLWRARWWRAIP
jgi:serine/threonine protein kinase